jgi:hypothetical protein
MNTTTTICPALDEVWAADATADSIAEHAASHDCNPAQAEFYLGFFELNVAKTVAQTGEAIDRCERAAQAVPDLRFSLVEEMLTMFAEDPMGAEKSALAAERQRELRARWTTLPCRPQDNPLR